MMWWLIKQCYKSLLLFIQTEKLEHLYDIDRLLLYKTKKPVRQHGLNKHSKRIIPQSKVMSMLNTNYDQWKLTPPEGKVISYDWKNQEIYSGCDEDYFDTPDGFVLNDRDEIEEYMLTVFRLTTAEDLAERESL